jgi:tRNA(Met) C34 N-acetyltransferase TmcA
MQSRPAAERPNRLSLLPLVQDLDEAAAGQPAAPPPPTPGPKSEMEWDEEGAPPRAQEKVRELFRQVLSRRERHTAAVAAAKGKGKAMAMVFAKTKAVQSTNHDVTSTTGNASSVDLDDKIKRAGSIQNARRGIAERRKLEVSFPHPKMRDINC